MPASAIARAVSNVSATLLRSLLSQRGVRNRDDGQGAGNGLALALFIPVGLIVGLVLGTSLLAGTAERSCSAGGGPLPGDFSRPGSLGGVGGTGVSRALVARVRTASPYAGPVVTPGRYVATAYGPPWGGIQGAGISTSGGLPIAGGAPRWYVIAADPAYLQHGNLVFAWPNPFDWSGPFLVADTGGAIVAGRIDFYDWRGRATQRAWGTRSVDVSARPIVATGGGVPDASAIQPPVDGPRSVRCDGAIAGSLAPPGATGKVVLAPGADRAGMPTQRPVLDFLARVAGVAGRPLVVTTGSNHSQFSSSGSVSDHWAGLAADLGSVANGFAYGGEGGTQIAAAALQVAGIADERAWELAERGGGHDVCFRGWRIQIIWRTGDHHDHVHVGLRRGCSFAGVRTFQI